jgi:hypothetical protein
MIDLKYGKPGHIPVEIFRGWQVPHVLNQWFLLIDGVTVISWIGKRQRIGRPIPFVMHDRHKKYRLIDILAIARGSGATLSLMPEYKQRKDISALQLELNTLKAELSDLLSSKALLLEQQEHFNTLAPYVHSEADIVAHTFKPLPSCGVYFLIEGNRVVYVGQSINIMGRLASHSQKNFEKVAFLPCPQESLSMVESFYIHMLRPRHNAQHDSGKMVAPVARESIVFPVFHQIQASQCR